MKTFFFNPLYIRVYNLSYDNIDNSNCFRKRTEFTTENIEK